MLKQMLKKSLPKPLRYKILNTLHRIELTFRRRLVSLCPHIPNAIGRLIEKKLGYTCQPIIWLDQYPANHQIAPAQPSQITPPNFGQNPAPITTPRPAINHYLINNAIVHPLSSHILTENAVIMERLPHIPVEQCNYATAHLYGHTSDTALINKPKHTDTLEQAWFLGGNAANNYYHFTLEILAKLHYIPDQPNLTLLIPQSVYSHPNTRQLIDTLLANRPHSLHLQPDNQPIKVRKLNHLTSPSNLVFNTAPGIKYQAKFHYYDIASLKSIRQTLLNSQAYQSYLKTAQPVPKKVFLARHHDSARPYNQSQALKLAQKYGYQPLYLETLSLMQQVHLFQNAEAIIGPSGAAWTNLIYINKNTKIISWLPQQLDQFSAYSTLAQLNATPISFISATPLDPKHIHSAYSLNLDQLEHQLKHQA